MINYICLIEDYDCKYISDKICTSEGECNYKKEINGIGYESGEVCNRDGCLGIIQEKEKESCYCHTGNPPCSSCTDPRAYCDECGWDEKEESDAIWQRNYEERKKIEEARKKEKEKMKEFIKTVPNRLVKLFGYEENI